MWTKLGRGVSNVVLAPVEIFAQPGYMAKTERWPIAAFGGVPKGILMTGARLGVGISEILTFPLPIPSHYRPIMEPELAIPAY